MTGDYDAQVRQQLADARAGLAVLQQRVDRAIRRGTRYRNAWARALDSGQEERTGRVQAEAERDGAYRERAHLVAWLSALHPAVITPAPDIDEPGWQIIYLQIASHMQASWHIAPADADLFKRVEHVSADDPRAQWDGHTTRQKYNRIRHHTTVVNLLSGGHAVDPATRAGAAEARIAAVRALAGRLRAEEAYGGRWDGLQQAADDIDATLDSAAAQPATAPCPGRPGFCRTCRTIHPAASSVAAPEFGPTIVPEPAPAPTMASLLALAEHAQAGQQVIRRHLEETIYRRAVLAGLTMRWEVSNVQEVAGHPTALARVTASPFYPQPSSTAPGSDLPHAGLPLVPDESLPPGEIHLRPHPRPATSPHNSRTWEDGGEWNVSCLSCPAYINNVGSEDDAERWAVDHKTRAADGPS